MSTKTFNFDTFSGTEMKSFLNIKLLKGDSASFDFTDSETELVTFEMGTVSAMAVSVTTQTKPKVVLGRSNPIGLATGVRSISGSLTYEVFNASVFEELKFYLTEQLADKDYEYVGFESGVVCKITDLDNFDSLPPFDLVITAVKENDQRRRMKKVIKNVVLVSNASAVGLNSLTVQENYEFIASDIVPFENHSIS
ncbi:MAG: hypothetical protein ACRCW9_03160 [Cetobacterium sp.]